MYKVCNVHIRSTVGSCWTRSGGYFFFVLFLQARQTPIRGDKGEVLGRGETTEKSRRKRQKTDPKAHGYSSSYFLGRENAQGTGTEVVDHLPRRLRAVLRSTVCWEQNGGSVDGAKKESEETKRRRKKIQKYTGALGASPTDILLSTKHIVDVAVGTSKSGLAVG